MNRCLGIRLRPIRPLYYPAVAKGTAKIKKRRKQPHVHGVAFRRGISAAHRQPLSSEITSSYKYLYCMAVSLQSQDFFHAHFPSQKRRSDGNTVGAPGARHRDIIRLLRSLVPPVKMRNRGISDNRASFIYALHTDRRGYF